MAKKQYFWIIGGLALVAVLFFFGKTVVPKKPGNPEVAKPQKSFDIQRFVAAEKEKLPLSQRLPVDSLESISIGSSNPAEQLASLQKLAAFWKDSVRQFEAHAFYLSKAAKLDNSEKNLTFAGQLILNNLRGEHDEAKLGWQANEAIGLFEKAIALNPGNEDLKIALGSCYIFGKGRDGNPQETMKGIQELLGVVRRDSLNMRAQLMLGIGGFVSGQYDKAITRLTTVISKEPGNIEAVAFLADTYAAKGDKPEAIRWYRESKRLVNEEAYSKEVDERIKQLQQ